MLVISAGAVRRLAGASRGKVHSCFEHAVNLCVGDALVQLADGGSAAAGCPFGIDLDSARWPVIAGRLGCVGMSIEWNPELLVGAPVRAHAVSRLTVSVEVARPLVELAGSLQPGLAREVLGGPARAAAREMLGGGELDASFWLVGRGPGLTPTGDDVLVGILAVLAATRRAGRAVDALLREASGRLTTDVSLEYLRAASEGEFSSSVLDVVAALAARRDPAAAVAALLSHGHTSGADVLFGMAAALDVLMQEGADVA